ncbi:MAG: hypothetical protein A3F35_00970 [Candidatus Woykebacteria bacterium RIFCSPHIGHO2_12_FULL_45_10]|uniref:Rhodanese domain-containing protein n=1 Tax=Candidatus Woykebacteria bacterium RIFCSPHIGHO2_12_FULL_45_10 TaxID=1802603 RepID=A0A1G1WRR7_9BACT|nr:MAG: hypothetical protein A3F35_00970 [Candidatus Woykebacteria bacterium RIFCSPHIGHO2_12_FULL_45_10]
MNLPAYFTDSRYLRLKIFALFFLFAVVVLIVLILQFGTNKFPAKPKQNLAAQLTQPTKITVAKTGETIYVPPRVKEVSPQQLKAFLDQKQPIKVVQVASEKEWNEAHIAGSIWLPTENLSYPPNLNPADDYILVSKDGVSTIEIIAKLIDHFAYGEEKIRNLKGGLDAWKAAGYPLVK